MSRWQNWALIGAVLWTFSGIAAEKPKTEATIPPTNGTETPPSRPGPAAAEPSMPYWPRFHGPQGDNISRETGLRKKWPEKGPKRLWTSQGIGDGFGCPSIARGLIFVSGNLKDKTTITALDLNGQIKWQVAAGDAWKDAVPGARSTPTIDGGCLYHESPLGQLVCLSAQSGKQLWSVNILKRFDAANISYGLAESVLIDGDHLICSPGGNHASLAALDKHTGKTVWAAKSAGDPAGYATPRLIEYRGLRILLTMSQKALLGVNADNGDLLFRHPHEVPKFQINATSPVFHDGQIFISSGYGSGSEMVKLRIDGKKASVASVWQSKELDSQHGGVVLLDGYLYSAAHQRNGGRWICLAWNDGTKKYAEKGVGKGSLTCADGTLYCWSENGQVGLVPATPEKHAPVSRFTVASGGDGPTWAHPVVCGGRLYLRHGNVLHAYDIRAEK